MRILGLWKWHLLHLQQTLYVQWITLEFQVCLTIAMRPTEVELYTIGYVEQYLAQRYLLLLLLLQQHYVIVLVLSLSKYTPMLLLRPLLPQLEDCVWNISSYHVSKMIKALENLLGCSHQYNKFPPKSLIFIFSCLKGLVISLDQIALGNKSNLFFFVNIHSF